VPAVHEAQAGQRPEMPRLLDHERAVNHLHALELCQLLIGVDEALAVPRHLPPTFGLPARATDG
jgi:hypothetical protein